MGNGLYTRVTVASAIFHALLIMGVMGFGLVQGCRYRKKKVELIEFTVAVNTGETEAEPVEAPPAEPEPEQPRQPDKPPELPPEPDRIPEPKPLKVPTKQTEKKPTEKKPTEKKPTEKKPTEKKPAVKKTIEKGRRVVRGPAKPPVKQTLSDEEIAKWLRGKARIGDKDSIPDSEQARNFAIVHDELYAAWEQPPASEAGNRPAEVEFALDATGRITGARIVQSSGSPVLDASVLDAVRRVGRVDGLSSRFLKAFPRLSVEFKIADG